MYTPVVTFCATSTCRCTLIDRGGGRGACAGQPQQVWMGGCCARQLAPHASRLAGCRLHAASVMHARVYRRSTPACARAARAVPQFELQACRLRRLILPLPLPCVRQTATAKAPAMQVRHAASRQRGRRPACRGGAPQSPSSSRLCKRQFKMSQCSRPHAGATRRSACARSCRCVIGSHPARVHAAAACIPPV